MNWITKPEGGWTEETLPVKERNIVFWADDGFGDLWLGAGDSCPDGIHIFTEIGHADTVEWDLVCRWAYIEEPETIKGLKAEIERLEKSNRLYQKVFHELAAKACTGWLFAQDYQTCESCSCIGEFEEFVGDSEGVYLCSKCCAAELEASK